MSKIITVKTPSGTAFLSASDRQAERFLFKLVGMLQNRFDPQNEQMGSTLDALANGPDGFQLTIQPGDKE